MVLLKVKFSFKELEKEAPVCSSVSISTGDKRYVKVMKSTSLNIFNGNTFESVDVLQVQVICF